jgi:hypothetical protein
MLAQIAGMVEAAILQIGAAGGDLGEGGLRQNILSDIVDRAVDDLVNEADETTSRRVIFGSTTASRPP